MRSPELLVRCAVRMTSPDSVTLIPLAGWILPWLVFISCGASDMEFVLSPLIVKFRESKANSGAGAKLNYEEF